MFPRSLLSQLEWSEYAGKFNPAITVEQPGDGLLVRPLQREDYDKGQSKLDALAVGCTYIQVNWTV